MRADGMYACNVVVDLEFTPVPKEARIGGLTHEIIEIGAVKLTPDGTVVAEFSHLVRPTLAKGVSRKVQGITGIRYEDLLFARTLPDVLEAFAAWVGAGRVRMVTWSGCDLKQITAECAAKGIGECLPHRWLDIQRLYPRLMGMPSGRKVALGQAADWCGIPNQKDEAHRALYDAKMTARIFRMMATGEFAEHRKRMSAELGGIGTAGPCTATIADQCSGLADLLQRLRASEAATAA